MEGDREEEGGYVANLRYSICLGGAEGEVEYLYADNREGLQFLSSHDAFKGTLRYRIVLYVLAANEA